MTKPILYQIIQFTFEGIEVQFSTTNKEKAESEFERYKDESEHEAYLVQVLDANMPAYVKGEQKYVYY